MSYLSDWIAQLEVGRTITADDMTVLRRVQMCLVSADKHHRQAREGQTMQDVLEQEVERQTKEITALHQTIARLERKMVDLQRDESKKVRDAERVVISRAVEFVDAVSAYDDTGFLVSSLVAAHIELRAAVAALLAAEAAV